MREEMVVIGADDFRKLAGERTGQVLIDAMQRSPARSSRLERPRLPMRVRDVEL